MQAFSFDNTFQIKFPRPSSKSQPKPPKDRSKEIVQIEQMIEPNKKILSEISILSDNIEKKEVFEENTQTLLNENEKLRRKLEFLSNILDNTMKFDENRDVLELKSFVRANYKRFHGILDEIYTYKEEIEKVKNMEEPLEKEKENLLKNLKNEQIVQNPAENMPNNFLENEITELESKLQEITKEIKEISNKNEKLRENVNKKPFFREYEMMSKEEEGLKKQNQSLIEMIKKEQERKGKKT